MIRRILIFLFLMMIPIKVSAREASGKFVDMGRFKLTAYCPCCDCSEGFDDSTSTMTTASYGRTIAVDPDVIPYGSKVLIGDTVFTAEDCGGAVQGDHIDIYMDSHDQVEEFGTRYTTVYIVKQIEY